MPSSPKSKGAGGSHLEAGWNILECPSWALPFQTCVELTANSRERHTPVPGGAGEWKAEKIERGLLSCHSDVPAVCQAFCPY